jgi:GTPase Era involved in 16S rRNA processing
VSYTTGFYLGQYDQYTSEIVAERAYQKWTDEIKSYSGPYSRVVINADRVTLEHFLIVVRDSSDGIVLGVSGKNLMLRDGIIDNLHGPIK